MSSVDCTNFLVLRLCLIYVRCYHQENGTQDLSVLFLNYLLIVISK